MAISDTVLNAAPFIDAGFMILTLIIIGVFVSRLNESVSKMKPNILGLILMALGLSFHILGHLVLAQVDDTQFFKDGFNHILFAFIAMAVVMFIIGSTLIAYHIASEENKSFMKVFAFIYGVLGFVNVIFHLSFFFFNERWTEDVFGTSPSRVDFYYILFEAMSLVVIYVLLLLQSRKSVRKAVSERFRLLSLTSLGFVLVIVVDALINLGIVETSGITVYVILFWLHVLTVGSLYLLVFFPLRYQTFRGIAPQTA
ncbi:MAG: hypothetical protein HeimC2_25250 [Candidatus Heimdallarchaeota archaeon LC_2]|nr:MAG: hypothetical protein HeimC2_25250 [Candidatus Heimdallarchaeota archaeon LC_2]